MLKKKWFLCILLSFLVALLPGMALGAGVSAAVNAGQVTITGQTAPGESVSLCVEREDGKRSYIHQLCSDENGDYQFIFSLDRGTYNASVSAKGEKLPISALNIEETSEQDQNNNEEHYGDESLLEYSAGIAVKGDQEKGWILADSIWTWSGKCTVMNMLKGILDKHGIDYSITYGGTYVQSIDGLQHKKEGFPNSGWMYKINGEIGGPANAEIVEDGDSVYWFYSLDYTQESNIDDSQNKLPELENLPEAVPDKGQTEERIAFDDVTDDIAWARDAIELLAGCGIIKGSGEVYEPCRSISRAEMLALLQRVHKLENEGELSTDFSDVKDTDWFFDSVMLALAHGWINGYEDGTFRPDDPISRNELACLLAKIAASGKKIDTAGESSFIDEEQIPSWALAAVQYARAEGLLSGYPDGSFRGQAYVSRAEAAVLVYNYWQNNCIMRDKNADSL